jgi:hypothetical protein
VVSYQQCTERTIQKTSIINHIRILKFYYKVTYAKQGTLLDMVPRLLILYTLARKEQQPRDRVLCDPTAFVVARQTERRKEHATDTFVLLTEVCCSDTDFVDIFIDRHSIYV